MLDLVKVMSNIESIGYEGGSEVLPSETVRLSAEAEQFNPWANMNDYYDIEPFSPRKS